MTADTPYLQLCCPDCGGTELADLDRLTATQAITKWRRPDGTVESGHPRSSQEITDGGETYGVMCENCGWEATNEGYSSLLVTEDEYEASQPGAEGLNGTQQRGSDFLIPIPDDASAISISRAGATTVALELTNSNPEGPATVGVILTEDTRATLIESLGGIVPDRANADERADVER